MVLGLETSCDSLLDDKLELPAITIISGGENLKNSFSSDIPPEPEPAGLYGVDLNNSSFEDLEGMNGKITVVYNPNQLLLNANNCL